MEIVLSADAAKLLELIVDVDRRKRAALKFPYFTLRMPARMTLGWEYPRLDRAAEELEEAGAIVSGQTLNDTYYKPSK